MKIRSPIYLVLLILTVSMVVTSCKPENNTPLNTQDAGISLSAPVDQKARTSFQAESDVLDLLVVGNEAWATTSGGVVRCNLENGNQRIYTTQDGLASNKVREIIRDSQGNIWVTCYVNGVSRFDGIKWDNFGVTNGLCSNDTITLAADKKGGVWVSAFWGVSYFDGKQWFSYSNVDPNGPVVGGPNPMKDCQNLTFVDVELSAVDVIFVDSRGNAWFSDRGKGATRFDGKDWRLFSFEDGMAEGGVSAIADDKDGNLWFGCGKGITRFDGNQFQIFTIKEHQSLIPRPFIQDIEQDRAGNIWVAAYQGGISRFDGVNWQTYTTSDGLVSDNAQSIFLDDKGNPGIITDKEVSRFNGITWQTLTSQEGLLEGKIRVAALDEKGNLWFGGAGGVSLYKPNP